jgi:hypothetical protein
MQDMASEIVLNKGAKRRDKDLLLTVLRTMFSALQDNEEIKSSAWMIILSIIPSDLVRTGALLLGGTIVISHIVHASALGTSWKNYKCDSYTRRKN